MFYHENDYLVPVLLGNEKNVIAYANAILRRKKARPHIFGKGFSLLSTLRYNCHKIAPWSEFWQFAALCDFAESLDAYYTPALILCGEYDRRIYDLFCEELEKRFVVINFEDYIQRKGENE